MSREKSAEGWAKAFQYSTEAGQLQMEVERLNARIAALEAERQWRDMATAPRDGTKIILRLRDTTTFVAGWSIPCEGSINHTQGITGPWAYADSHSWHYIQPSDVTRWLPLPPLPEKEEGDA